MTKIWSKNWNQNDSFPYYNPYLISCIVPIATQNNNNNNDDEKVEYKYISLSRDPCVLSGQKFKIHQLVKQEMINKFTICVKPLNFENGQDIRERLLQWIVMNSILGADKFEINIGNISDVTEGFLKELSKIKHFDITLKKFPKITDSLDVNMTTNPDDVQKIWQKRRYEIISYNDCLYRNIHSSKYIIPIDIDEIIVPRCSNIATWSHLLDDGNSNVASYTVTNAYYFRFAMATTTTTAVSKRPFFLRDIVRSQLSPAGESSKSFVATSNTLTVFNHYALHVLRPGIQSVKFLDPGCVQMNHYKSECDVAVLPQCAKYLSSRVRVVDDVISRFVPKFWREYSKIKGILLINNL